MNRIFNIDLSILNKQIKRYKIYAFLFLGITLLIETFLLIFLNRGNKLVFLILIGLIFIFFSILFSYFLLYLVPLLKQYKKMVELSETTLVNKTAVLLKLDNYVFRKGYLKFVSAVFEVEGKQISLEINEMSNGIFIVGKTYIIEYKGATLYGYSEENK